MLEVPSLADADIDRLTTLLRGRRLAVLTGAGISTESGIPDYRGPETRRRARQPIRFADYMASDTARARYWARAMVGWERFRSARPNEGHRALAALETDRERFVGLITQNVDRLHHDAGSRHVIELHGALAEALCLGCGRIEDREVLQWRLRDANPWLVVENVQFLPDGDADLDGPAIERFRPVGCAACGGTMKPNVVFFGENVEPERVARAYAWIDEADALLVVGSSLTVFSGYRFVRRAAAREIPIAIVNLGETRADELATLKLDASAGQALPRLVARLASERATG